MPRAGAGDGRLLGPELALATRGWPRGQVGGPRDEEGVLGTRGAVVRGGREERSGSLAVPGQRQQLKSCLFSIGRENCTALKDNTHE